MATTLGACGPEASSAGAPVDQTKPEGAGEPADLADLGAFPRSNVPLLDLEALDDPADDCVSGGPQCADVPVVEGLTRYPIVMAHGMGGFDEALGILEYWSGIPTMLRDAGHSVYVSVVDPLNGSDVRAAQLAANIDRVLACTCADKVNIIAHSQGGIDARYLVNVLGYADRVDSVTTVATPHKGTAIADFILQLAPEEADRILNLLGWLVTEIYADPEEDTALRAALTWVSEAHLAEFEAQYPTDFEAVPFYSYGGRAGIFSQGKPECEDLALPNPKHKSPISAFMLPGYTALGGLIGTDNDGLVTIENARYGLFRGCLPADHMQEIGLGFPQSWDHVAFYLQHTAFLIKAGH